ncbi:RagB/SusD family nutrient uptake outer membrane protein [Pedobacter miscanthi]|uniref:RagB/SusD family nutrient uptake outer membrane protein n=1 Tax=Pedobacter miscanthi TaxID=2259170 RepID=A0A366KPG2_9SPHI|nr:RagB/SusD family nutrient uptake outer membrane protein [Pedobacter miscanthi]RBQ02672.1 RagB/SusD family nutrient uptake outer membrane protein [Pedobacter miscanthi]
MKLIKSIIYLSFIAIVGVGCSKDLNVDTPDQFSDDNFWTSENNVRTYNWGFYALFTGFGTGTTADFYFSTLTDDQDAATFQNFVLTAPTTSADWDWTYVRKANIMLERVNQIPMSDEAKKHWNGIAKFFRAMDYFNKVKTFGGVPYISKSLDVSQTDVIYKPRDSRQLVMDSILSDINYAVANIRVNDGDNVVNRDVALALKARICLFEGSYRVYHTELSLPDADKFLTEGKDACEKLMTGKYLLNADYRSIYSSMDLAGNKEVLLYKKYLAGVLTHSVIGYTNSTTQMSGLTKSAVDAYPATDGLPIGQSPLYQGDNTITTLRANRDNRLLGTIDNFLCYNGTLVNGYSSSTGYRPSKFLNPASNQLAPYNETDAPIFYYPEVLLNYGEITAILDKMGKLTFTQADMDKSINLLRTRAGITKLTVTGGGNVAAGGTAIADPKRDADVSALMWEIRRERRVELMMNGFRYQDLMRWKKGEYLDRAKNVEAFLGAKVPDNGKVLRNAQGYIVPYATTLTRTFVDPKNYLSAIPTGQISLYPANTLQQNPGW